MEKRLRNAWEAREKGQRMRYPGREAGVLVCWAGISGFFGAVVEVLAGFVVVVPTVGVGAARVGVDYYGKGEEKGY